MATLKEVFKMIWLQMHVYMTNQKFKDVGQSTGSCAASATASGSTLNIQVQF